MPCSREILQIVLRLKAQNFHLRYQKSLLRQIKQEVQNRPITKNGVLPLTTWFFFENLIWVQEPFIFLINLWFCVRTTQMPILSLSTVVVFEGAFSLWTPLKVQPCKLYNNKYRIGSTQITNNENFAFSANYKQKIQ